MQTVNREQLLGELESVTPGLSKREAIEQASCFVFKDGKVITFNDEVACFQKCSVKLDGAVQAQPLLDLLRRLTDDEVTVLTEEKDGAHEFIIKGKRGRAGLTFEAAVLLPVDKIEIPKKWQDLHKDFTDAVNMVQHCASNDESMFAVTCVHIAPGFVEATDRVQIARYELDTGFSASLLIRRNALKSVMPIGMTQFVETPEWVWFRNPVGLSVAVRRHTDNFVDLSQFLKLKDAKPATLPKSIAETAEKCEIFSSQNAAENFITIRLTNGKIRFEGRGANGWYRETRKIDYAGPTMEFIMAPELLAKLVKNGNSCEITAGKLRVGTGKFSYVTCLRPPSAVGGDEQA